MSVDAMRHVFAQSKSEHSDRLVMLALADRAGEYFTCFPSYEDVMSRTRLSRAAVHQSLYSLAEQGELHFETKAHRGRSNLYLLAVGLTKDQIVAALVSEFEYKKIDALDVAASVIQKMRNRPERIAKQTKVGNLKRQSTVQTLDGSNNGQPSKLCTDDSPNSGRLTVQTLDGNHQLTLSESPIAPDADAPDAVENPKDETNMREESPVEEKPSDYLGHVFQRLTDIPISVRRLRKGRGSEEAKDFAEKFYYLTGLTVMAGKVQTWLTGAQQLHEACGGNFKYVRDAYDQLTRSRTLIVDPYSLVNTTNTLYSAAQPKPVMPGQSRQPALVPAFN
jgi:hypothetical protein